MSIAISCPCVGISSELILWTDDAYDSIISTNLKGSVFWMAPEVVHSVKGQGYSAKVDIWSLGCVVLEMWAGRRPWGDMEALAAMFQVRLSGQGFCVLASD